VSVLNHDVKCSGGVTPCVFSFSIRWRWMVSSMAWGKSPQYPLEMRLNGTQRQLTW